jgi:H+/Cl- antiporter ClcA
VAPAITHPLVRDRVFWQLVGTAVGLGLAAGVLSLGFVAVVGFGTDLWWPDDPDYGLLEGEAWWLLVTTGAGLLVGLVRLVTTVPKKATGALAEVATARVDDRTAPQMVLISAISLIGGASLGPFDAGVRSGGAAAEWWSARRGLPEDQRAVNVLSGIAGGVGALVTAPFAAALLNLELGTLDHRAKMRALVPNLVAASMGFAVFYVTVGSSFLDLYEVGPYELKAWHLAAAVPLGAAAAVIMIGLVTAASLVRRLVDRLPAHPVLLAAGGGLAFGIAGVVLPLTLLSGKDQLADAIDQMTTLSAGLLLAVLLVKILTFSVSMATGFIGGPVMPSLFLGGIAGLAVHVLIPDLPLALTLSTMLVAVPGAVVKAPFTMMALAAITVSVGPITVAPAGIAVITAYLLTSGLELFESPKPQPGADQGPPDQS